MHRYCISLLSVVLLLLGTATPGFAWWDYLEQFSGPGPTPFGGDVQFRVFCYPDSDQPQPPVHSGRDVGRLGGAFISLCLNRRDKHVPERRVVSFDVGVLAAWIPPDEDFAQNKSVWFTSVTPAVMWSFIPSPRKDFVDYGFGVGVYRFISGGFTPFSGVYLEPLRFDFHAPTETRYGDADGIRRWLRRTVVRFSPMLFLDGFEEDAFRPSPARRKAPRTEWVPVLSVYIDLEGVLHLR